jgi:3-oxoacyl-[acyl-carrier-protein] synthase II
MKNLQISGLGLVGGFGCGKSALLSALERQTVPVNHAELRGHQFPLFKADSSPLENYLDKRALRRIDHFSRLALLGAFQALDDAGNPPLDKRRLGVVIGSGFGALSTTFDFLDSVLDAGDACASPTAFSNSVHNAAAAHLSMKLQLTGPSLTVSQFDLSLVSGLITAQQWLDEGRVDAVLLGVVDEYCPVLGYCWERFNGPTVGAMTPLDLQRQSAVAGEGAAFFLLQLEAAGLPAYGHINRVEMGNLQSSAPTLDPLQPLLLGCDGQLTSGAHYHRLLDSTRPVACYTPLYGSSPMTQGFDLAVAALSLHQGALFPSTDAGGDYFSGPVVSTTNPCTGLCALHFSPAGDYGAIHLSQCGS